MVCALLFAHVMGCKLSPLLRRDVIIQWSYAKVCVRAGKTVSLHSLKLVTEKSWPWLGT